MPYSYSGFSQRHPCLIQTTSEKQESYFYSPIKKLRKPRLIAYKILVTCTNCNILKKYCNCKKLQLFFQCGSFIICSSPLHSSSCSFAPFKVHRAGPWPGCEFDPQSEQKQEATNDCMNGWNNRTPSLSPSLSLSLFVSLSLFLFLLLKKRGNKTSQSSTAILQFS